MFRKKIKYKYIKRCKGMISIFLCLIMTPCLSLVSSLIEYSRYQEAMQTVREAMDVSTTATLSNYDEYLNKRFGLLSVAQDKDIKDIYSGYTETNIGLLGKAVDINNISAYGTVPLSNTDIFRQQINDFSETTALMHSALKDFNIEEIINKLENLEIVDQILGISEKASNLSGFVKDGVSAAEALVSQVEKINTSMTTVSAKTQNLVSAVEQLLRKIDRNEEIDSIEYDNEKKKLRIIFNESAGDIDEENEDEVNQYLVDTYSREIKNVAEKVFELQNAITTLKSDLDGVPTKYETFKTAVNNAKAELNDFKSNTEVKSEDKKEEKNAKSNMDATTQILETIINALNKALTKMGSQLKKETVDSFKNAMTQAVSNIKSELGIDASVKKYSSIKNNTTKKAEIVLCILKRDITGVVNILLPDDFETYKTNIFNINNVLKDAVETAKKQLGEDLKKSFQGAVQGLLDALGELFNLQLAYDGNLDAVLSNEILGELPNKSDDNNFYVQVIEAIGKFVSSSNSFISGITYLNYLEILTSMKELYDAIHKLFEAIKAFITNVVKNLKRIAGYATGNLKELYNDYLLAAYFVHNLPNRINYASGIALTGFDFKDIKYAKNVTGYKLPSLVGGITGMKSVIDTVSGKSGDDSMFCGAELEYLFAGTKSEVCNQTIAFMNIYLLRLLLDIIPVFTDEGVTAMAASATIASWVVYLIVLLGEPLCDTVMLVNGMDCTIIKRTCYLSPKGIPIFLDKLTDKAIQNDNLKEEVNGALDNTLKSHMSSLSNKPLPKYSEGIFPADYQTHMLLSIMLSCDPGDILDRGQNLVQLEAKEYYKKEKQSDFQMKKAYTAIHSDVNLTFNPFIDIFKNVNSSIFTKDLAEQRGY